MYRTLTVVYFIFFSSLVYSQLAGKHVYEFLNITTYAKVGALGGNNVSLRTGNINEAVLNPALLSDSISNNLVLNYMSYISSVKSGYVSYGYSIPEIGNFSIGIQSLDYGEFDRTDENFQGLGTFSGGEYALNITYSRALTPNIYMGITFKPIYSKLDNYSSFGIASDFGVNYYNEDKNLSVGLVIKNIGTQITAYNDKKESLPSDVQIGISKKLQYAPFRFSVTLHNLFNNVSYSFYDVEQPNNLSGEDADFNYMQQLFRHMVFGLEFIPSKNFHIDFGYNHKRRKELGYTERISTAGFSWGFGFKIYKFRFSYASARYHLAGTTNNFSLTTNLSDFF